MSDKPSPTGLTAAELACLTARVPASGNPYVDKLITRGLRDQTAMAVFEHLVHEFYDAVDLERVAKVSVAAANALIAEFRK